MDAVIFCCTDIYDFVLNTYTILNYGKTCVVNVESASIHYPTQKSFVVILKVLYWKVRYVLLVTSEIEIS